MSGIDAARPLSTTTKLLGLGAGTAAGVGLGFAARAALPSAAAEARLEQQGVESFSDVEATATFAPLAFMGAAAVGAGIGKRTSSAALTTVSLGAAALLASTGASTMVNADSEHAFDYLRTLGLMGVTTAGAFAVGAMDEIPLNRAKLTGLALIGLAAGGLAGPTASYVAEVPGQLGTSWQHRNE
ncbi:MAG: hypothetical protein JWN72_1978 [Thermoleophilia bacterium]|nr:hypothetical protein [Thermoleophilia bacterium]